MIGHLGTPDNVFVRSVGHGVSLTHLHGQTVRDLILKRDTDLTRVFFVDRKAVPWPRRRLRNPATRAIAGFMRREDHRYDVLPPGSR